MALHEHVWRPAGHLLRCADPDCLAWLPPRSDEPTEPVQRPARKRKPAREANVQPVSAGEGSNVVPLRRR